MEGYSLKRSPGKHVKSSTIKRHQEDPAYRKEYPCICINGSHSYEFFHSENRQQAAMREFHPWLVVKISPQAVEDNGITEDQWIWIENTEGCRKQVAHIDPTLDPHYIHAEHGWWFPEQGLAAPHLYRSFDSNINNLTTSCTQALSAASAIR